MIWTYVAAALLSGVLAFGGAWKVQDWRYGAMESDRLEAVRESTRLATRSGDVAATGHEVDKAEIRTEFKTIYRDVERIVEKPIYTRECFDADGLNTLEGSIRHENIDSHSTVLKKESSQ